MESNDDGFMVHGGYGCDVVSEMVSSDGKFVVNDRCGVVSENANMNSDLAKASEGQSWTPLAQA